MLIKKASWISLKQAAPTVVPVFRKQFPCEKPILAAELEVTCDGVYEAVLNGRPVSVRAVNERFYKHFPGINGGKKWIGN